MEVEVTDEFVDWWSTLTIEQQERSHRSNRRACRTRTRPWSSDRRQNPCVAASVDEGTQSSQGRCAPGAVHLRSTSPSILLFGGDKSGEWNDWYEWAVPLADDLYDEYLRELGEEGLI